ncbi:MAG: GNAT family N-acetyltransferase [Capnocytophaga sp.]|nr:GNAT family N-acetyltransferase [Capnocytophaga sp.]
MHQRIPVSPTDALFASVWTMYEDSFPAEERRTLSQHQQLMNHSEYRFEALLHVDEAVGFLGYWAFENLIFIEHFAVVSSQRGAGLGSLFLKNFLAENTKRILLEVEIPENEPQQKRILFYQKFGFHLNETPYFQPPYQSGFPSVPMRVMTFPQAFSESEINNFVQNFHPIIYGTIL